MRLIRLQTSDTNCVFDNNFQSDILLKQNASIALQNLTIEFNPLPIVINQSNDTITYQITNSQGPVTVSIPNREYTYDQRLDLLQDIQDAMNDSLDIDVGGKLIGLEWKASINDDNRVEIEYMQSAANDFPEFELDKVDISAGGVITSTGAGAESAFYNTTDICKGVGIFRVRLANLQQNGTDNCLIFGLMTQDPEDATDFQEDEYYFAIGVSSISRDYNVIDEGVQSNTPTFPNIIGNGNPNNDYLEVCLTTGKVELRVYQNGSSTPVVLASKAAPPFENKLFPCCTMEGDSSIVSLNGLRYTADPFDANVSGVPASSTDQNNIYGDSAGSTNSILGKTANRVYNSYATTGAKTNGTYIDASDPDWQNNDNPPTEYEDNSFYAMLNNVLTFFDALMSYRFKEISIPFTGLDPAKQYSLALTMSDLDERQDAWKDSGQTQKVLEFVRVYNNGSEIGTLSALAGGGDSQTVTKYFHGLSPDVNGTVTLEISLPFTWLNNGGNWNPDFNTQQGARVENSRLYDDKSDALTAPPRQSVSPSNNMLQFGSSSLSSYLGFTQLRIPTTGFFYVDEPLFEAKNTVDNIDLADNFVVEMLSLELDSYDGKDGERRSILGTVPNSDQSKAVLYQAPQPIFIDLRNAQPLSLRNIRARVLKNDLSSIVIRGLATMTILVND